MTFFASKCDFNSLIESYNSRRKRKGVEVSQISEEGIEYVVKKLSAAGIDDSATEGSDGVSEGDSKREMARSLIDPELLWEHFFHEIMDTTVRAIKEDTTEMKRKFSHHDERQQAKKRAEQRFVHVCHFPVKIMFSCLRRHQCMANVFASMLHMPFGPLHVALQVGGVVLDWDDRNLVSPSFLPYKQQVLELNVQHLGKWMEFVAQYRQKMHKAVEYLDFSTQLNISNKIADEKRSFIKSLISLVIHYNSYYRYDVINRNCQHFVLEALSILQIELPSRDLPGDLGLYYAGLIKGKPAPSIQSRYRNHYELDARVCRQGEDSIADLSLHELEFLQAAYFHFHRESRAKQGELAPGSACGNAQCCMEQLERLIKLRAMEIHIN